MKSKRSAKYFFSHSGEKPFLTGDIAFYETIIPLLIAVFILLLPVLSYGSHNEPERGEKTAEPEEESKRFAR